MKEPKYRPSLTLPQLKYLLTVLTASNPNQLFLDLHNSVLAILRTLEFKASVGIAAPAYTAAPKETAEQKLGFSPAITKEQAYQKSLEYPQLCTASERQQARLYRYENDLMTPEEEEAFENE